MRRRPRLKTMPFGAMEPMLKKERKNREDVYLPLSRIHLEPRDLTAPLRQRYQVVLDHPEVTRPLFFSRTALGQLSRLTEVPLFFLEKLPPALGLNVLRSMLTLVAARRENSHLLRLKQGPRATKLRAILPSGFVRFDDELVHEEMKRAMGSDEMKVVSLAITEDLFATRMVFPKEFNLGTTKAPDISYAGIDVRASETGAHPLQVREVLFRLVCENGMTQVSKSQTTRIRKTGNLDRAGFKSVLRETLATAVRNGGRMADRLGDSRHDYVQEPVAEVAQIFRRYNLGSPRGRIGRWIMEEMLKTDSLLGVRKFDLIQAFTAVAQRLEHAGRLQLEDAMSAYLMEGAPARGGAGQEDPRGGRSAGRAQESRDSRPAGRVAGAPVMPRENPVIGEYFEQSQAANPVTNHSSYDHTVSVDSGSDRIREEVLEFAR